MPGQDVGWVATQHRSHDELSLVAGHAQPTINDNKATTSPGTVTNNELKV